ncbi:hypothetical protein QYF61_008497 [Mycteria americana]|uniref:Uncharacterized protein n=1 Tax=Mycteria americana TaxID=33587 RepID=A0AAN7RQK5_MYCAM|nr:hypothetical protein QYF61_008497 [Mycteria americana]
MDRLYKRAPVVASDPEVEHRRAEHAAQIAKVSGAKGPEGVGSLFVTMHGREPNTEGRRRAERNEKVLCRLPVELNERLRWCVNLNVETQSDGGQAGEPSRERCARWGSVPHTGSEGHGQRLTRGATSDENHSVRLWNRHGAGEVRRLGGVMLCTDKGSVKMMMRKLATAGLLQWVTCSVDGGRAADVVFPDCSEAFDSFPQLPSGILLHSGVDNWLVGWMGKWVTGHTQRMVANSSF